MLFAFLTTGQWVILAGIAVIAALLAVPAARPYLLAVLRSGKTLVACLILCVVLLITSVVIVIDAEYLLMGHETEAVITKVQPKSKSVHVEYRFTDADGEARTGSDTASAGWTAPAGGTVTVQYLAGENGHSRLSRYIVHWFPYVLFVVSALMLLLINARVLRRAMRGP